MGAVLYSNAGEFALVLEQLGDINSPDNWIITLDGASAMGVTSVIAAAVSIMAF
jgi:hypothetical protein